MSLSDRIKILIIPIAIMSPILAVTGLKLYEQRTTNWVSLTGIVLEETDIGSFLVDTEYGIKSLTVFDHAFPGTNDLTTKDISNLVQNGSRIRIGGIPSDRLDAQNYRVLTDSISVY